MVVFEGSTDPGALVGFAMKATATYTYSSVCISMLLRLSDYGYQYVVLVQLRCSHESAEDTRKLV